MNLLPGIALTLLALLAGCATPPREVLATSARTIVVTGFEPVVRGVNVGTTVFQNREWVSAPVGFDANAIASQFIAKTLVQPIPVIDGRTSGLAMEKGDRFLWSDPSKVELSRRLAALGQEKNVDRIILLTTGVAKDWIAGTNQRLKGFGLYRFEMFGLKRMQAYGVFQLQVFDCQTQTFTAADTLPGARQVYAIEWHDSWEEFPPPKQRRVLAAYSELLTEHVAQLLTRAGLANTPLPPERPLAQRLLLMPKRPTSWLPEGNVLRIPEGVSRAQARLAVVRGLKARGWTVAAESDGEIVGFIADRKKEVRVTALLTEDQIMLVPNDREIAADGSVTPVSPHTRWHSNLKESIYRDLIEAEELGAKSAAGV